MDSDRPRWWGSTAFRITLLHLVLTLLGTAALSGVAWWASTSFALRQLAQDVERDSGVLTQAVRLGGPGSAALSLRARLAAHPRGAPYHLLTRPDGARLGRNQGPGPR